MKYNQERRALQFYCVRSTIYIVILLLGWFGVQLPLIVWSILIATLLILLKIQLFDNAEECHK